MVEKDKVGGTCLHRGCIPTKALLHAAEVADSTRESSHFGVKATLEGIDMAGVNTYKDGVVGRLYKGLTGLVKSRNVTVVEGTGRLSSPTTVTVTTADGEITLTGKNVVLASGSYARSLPGLDISGRIMTSDQALNLDYVPKSVIVLGGGVIGSEFASVWRSFGCEVTIVEGLPRLVPAEDESCSKALDRAFRKRGMTIKTGVRFASATQDASSVTVTLEDGTTITADLLLVAVGRGPNTEGMGYEQVGVTMERGWVITDERCNTTEKKVLLDCTAAKLCRARSGRIRP
jgi:dihydrolipoamide dehydrogenase